MLRPRYKGTTIEIRLPKEYEGYSVECTYKYIKSEDKYKLSMWLKYNNIHDKFKIESQEISTQLISGTRETIVDNISRVVEQMCDAKSFEEYISRYEYTYNCFDRGNELIEEEKIIGARNESD